MTQALRIGGASAGPGDGDPGADPELRPLLDGWRAAGRDLVAAHRAELSALIAAIDPLTRRGHHARAAAAAQVAANHAVIWHPGAFASPALDAAIARLGAAALPTAGGGLQGGSVQGESVPRGAGPLHVLHVVTQATAIGGHVRMLSHWIAADGGNRHSLALTRQTTPPPAPLVGAVQAAGGTIRYVNRDPGGILAWARDLQSAFAGADLVVLHVYNQDIIPFLAMAGMARRPPVLLLNHADHVFWLGAGLVDGVISSRRSGHQLCARRRGIPAERNLTLPLCLEPPAPLERGPAAKRAIGLPADSVVILTLARSVKFRAVGGRSFADALVPVLEEDPRRHLVAVGPKGSVDWSAAQARVPGRIHLLAETPDTRAYFAAADLYVDSFPFPSITSMLEAGLHGLPVVTRYPFGPGNEIMGGDSIGLDAGRVVAQSLGDYRRAVRDLAADPARRADLGGRLKADIERINMGAEWRSALARIYDAALSLPRRRMDGAGAAGAGAPAAGAPEVGASEVGAPEAGASEAGAPGTGALLAGPPPEEPADLDLFVPFVFGTVLDRPTPALRLAHARELALKTMPGLQRLAVWGGLALHRRFSYSRGLSVWRGLVPEPLTVRLRIPRGAAGPGRDA